MELDKEIRDILIGIFLPEPVIITHYILISNLIKTPLKIKANYGIYSN